LKAEPELLLWLFFLIFCGGWGVLFERFFSELVFFGGKMKVCFFGCLFFRRLFGFEWS